MNALDKFNLKNKVAIVTGGAGFLGRMHIESIIEANGTAIILDISQELIDKTLVVLHKKYGNECNVEGYAVDITKKEDIHRISQVILKKYNSIDILINNAANNPKVEGNSKNMRAIQFENFPLDMWNDDVEVGLTGAFICSQVFGAIMEKQRQGVILNISSDLGIVAPDQRIYKKEGVSDSEQNFKPVTYSVIKHGLIGLSKYLATYYADKNIRVNTLCPAGVYNGQDEEFIKRLTNLIPMGRMAREDEYKSTILYLVSDASSYMTGSTVIVDGGRTCW